jgi:hypothetical protein
MQTHKWHWFLLGVDQSFVNQVYDSIFMAIPSIELFSCGTLMLAAYVINNSRCYRVSHQHNVNTAAVLSSWEKRLSRWWCRAINTTGPHTPDVIYDALAPRQHISNQSRAQRIFEAAAGFISPPISSMSHGSCVWEREREWAPVCLRRQH